MIRVRNAGRDGPVRGGSFAHQAPTTTFQPRTFHRAVIKQAFPELQRVRRFAIEYLENDQWKVCYRGENLGARLVAKFPPVTARRARLHITEATEGPTIWEFQLFE